MRWWTILQLKSRNASKRLKTVEKLAASPGGRNFEHLLIAALKDENGDVRSVATEAVARARANVLQAISNFSVWHAFTMKYKSLNDAKIDVIEYELERLLEIIWV